MADCNFFSSVYLKKKNKREEKKKILITQFHEKKSPAPEMRIGNLYVFGIADHESALSISGGRQNFE